MKLSATAREILKPGKRTLPAWGTAALLAAETLLAGCSMQPFNPTQACVWPGSRQSASWQTASGDLYQVTLSGPQYARIDAELNNHTLFVKARYDMMPYNVVDPATGSVDGLTIESVRMSNPWERPPSQADLMTKYEFAGMAIMTEHGFYDDRKVLPTAICRDSQRIDGYGDSRMGPSGPVTSRVQKLLRYIPIPGQGSGY